VWYDEAFAGYLAALGVGRVIVSGNGALQMLEVKPIEEEEWYREPYGIAVLTGCATGITISVIVGLLIAGVTWWRRQKERNKGYMMVIENSSENLSTHIN
jgi:hypothetical protein